MFRPLGLLTLQLPDDNNQYIYVAEVGIPLLEGGLLYRGSFSDITESSVMDLLVFVDKHATDLFHFDQQEAGDYLVSVTPVLYPFDPIAQLVVHADPENAQLFSGQITQDRRNAIPSLKTVKFIYRDINEPITLGVIALVAIGAMAVMCVSNRVLESKDCRGRIKATYGINWRIGELGCTTERLEKTKSTGSTDVPSNQTNEPSPHRKN